MAQCLGHGLSLPWTRVGELRPHQPCSAAKKNPQKTRWTRDRNTRENTDEAGSPSFDEISKADKALAKLTGKERADILPVLGTRVVMSAKTLQTLSEQ